MTEMQHIGALLHQRETKNLSKLDLIACTARMATANKTATCTNGLRNSVIALLGSGLLTNLNEIAVTERALFLPEEDLGIDDSDHSGANHQVIPNELRDGRFTRIPFDFASFSYDDLPGEKPGDDQVAFDYISNGIPGIETRKALLYYEGAVGDHVSATRFVELTATNSAKAYDLHPGKDTMAIVSVADVVILNDKDVTITNAMLHHAVNYTQHECMPIRLDPPPLFLASKSSGMPRISADAKAERTSVNTALLL